MLILTKVQYHLYQDIPLVYVSLLKLLKENKTFSKHQKADLLDIK